jgi:septum formation protein
MENQRTIILASASPRRRELLEKIGLKFAVDPSLYPEDVPAGPHSASLSPEGIVKALSMGKAAAVALKHPDAIVIAADTLGVLRGKIIGKPGTAEEARGMLLEMSGKSHRVITGFTILDNATRKMITRTIDTRVYFRRLSLEEINNYVKTGEPLDKAGAYAIQGLGSLIVEKINGDYYNVMGLPLNALAESLKEFGIRII